MKNPSVKLIAASISLALSAGAAQAVLERAGPTSNAPSVGGFPSWYQDTTGVALEFCDPKNQAEVDGGWCLLLPGDVNVPEVFPTNFFDEHFWFAADAAMTPANGGKALLVLAVEAAFAADVAPGGQIAFSRIRVVLNPVPATGTYRIIHPYGEETVEAVAGERIFITDDVGIGCPQGNFDCATESRLGPFLLPANTPGGDELPPISGPVAGKLYIADPGRSGPVTGSTLPNFIDSNGQSRNHNIFRIEGPAGSDLGGPGINFIETTDFSLMGRIFNNTIAGRIDVDRATYTRNESGQQLDVHASAFPTTQGRLPAQARPAAVAPQLSVYDAPCAGTVDAAGTIHPPYSAPLGATETQMYAVGNTHWGQTQPAVLPAVVCVKDGSARDVNGVIRPAFSPQALSDLVTIGQAVYDPARGTLNVTASSSDTAAPPVLTAIVSGARHYMNRGQLEISGLIAPPARVRVLSSAHGTAELAVSSLASAGAAPAGIPVANNDSFSLVEDAGAQNLNVLFNDSGTDGGTVNITGAPRLGSLMLNADNTVTYTPNLNASGADAFTYTVTVGGQVSNTGNVTIDIAPVNDAPTAVNDSASAIANIAQSINLLANDSDPDGVTDLVAAVNLTQPIPAGASVSVVGGIATFTATQGGSYSFTYQAQDSAWVSSANTATVTVQVAAGEALTVTRGEYVVSKSRLRLQGSLTPPAGQTIKLEWISSSGAALGTIATVTPDAAGAWVFDGVTPMPNGASIRVTSSNGTTRVTTVTRK